jgi:hypothetical protein
MSRSLLVVTGYASERDVDEHDVEWQYLMLVVVCKILDICVVYVSASAMSAIATFLLLHVMSVVSRGVSHTHVVCISVPLLMRESSMSSIVVVDVCGVVAMLGP